jgi:hypothetical protein
MVRVPGYRSRDPELNSQHYQIFLELLGHEWGPFSLESARRSYLKEKVAVPV